MTHLLVYTQNYYLQSAIESLVDDAEAVTFFSNKSHFLVCATILNDSVLLIDAIDNNQTVRWLHDKIMKHKGTWNINFIAPSRIASFNLATGFSLITNILQLKSIFRFTRKKTNYITRTGIHDSLISRLHRKLPSEDIAFILTLYDGVSGKYRKLSIQEINRLYYIRSKKLSLNSSFELKILISFLSSSRYSLVI